MKRLTAYISGKVQKVGYRARVIQAARVLGLTGTVENLADGRVKIVAEGDDDKLKWFEKVIYIKDDLIQVADIETEYSPAIGELSNFYKLVGEGETDARLDTAAYYLKDLIAAVNNMNNNLGGKIDDMNSSLSGKMDEMNSNLGGKMDRLNAKMVEINGNLGGKIDKLNSKMDEINDNLGGKIDKVNVKMDEMNSNLGGKMDRLLVEAKESRRDLKGFLDQRFERIESDVADIKFALKAKGII